MPIMTKIYQSAGGAGGMPGGMPDMSAGGMGGMPDMGGAAGGAAGPKVEEVD